MATNKSYPSAAAIAKSAAELRRAREGNAELKRILKEFKVEDAKKGAARAIKKVPKASIAKRILGKTLAKAIPGLGAAIIARDVVKGISKSTCSKRGGKWVSGKCVGAKKTKFKAGSKVRDPISKR